MKNENNLFEHSFNDYVAFVDSDENVYFIIEGNIISCYYETLSPARNFTSIEDYIAKVTLGTATLKEVFEKFSSFELLLKRK